MAPTYRDSFQVQRPSSDDRGRETSPSGSSGAPVQRALQTRSPENIGLGYHRVFSPGSDLAVSGLILQQDRADKGGSLGNSVGTGILEGPQLEIQQVFRLRRMTWVMGAGGFSGEARLEGAGCPRRSRRTTGSRTDTAT